MIFLLMHICIQYCIILVISTRKTCSILINFIEITKITIEQQKKNNVIITNTNFSFEFLFIYKNSSGCRTHITANATNIYL